MSSRLRKISGAMLASKLFCSFAPHLLLPERPERRKSTHAIARELTVHFLVFPVTIPTKLAAGLCATIPSNPPQMAYRPTSIGAEQ